MDGEHVEQILRLMAEGESVEEGPHQIALFEEAVRLADAHNDLVMSFRTRRRLMAAAMCGGQPDLLMVAFAWCLAQSDRDPQRFRPEDLLWAYRWVICELTGFPQVERPKFDELLTEMERRYRAAGSTLRGYWLLRNRMEGLMGNFAAAGNALEQFECSRRDWLSDRPVVEQAFRAYHLLALGDDAKTLLAFEPILANVHRNDFFVGMAQAMALAPLMRLGRVDEAMGHHVRGYRSVGRNPRYVARVGDHFAFLALTDNHSRALALLARHLPVARATIDEASRFKFYLNARLVLDLLRDQGKASVKLRLTHRFPLYRTSGDYALAELIAWFDTHLDDLATRFDARNGNDHHRRQVTTHAALKAYAKPFPLPSATNS
jgi:hypothetical protein